MDDGAALRTQDIGTVHDQFFTLRDFRLANGAVLPEATIVYETYGRLAPDEPKTGKGCDLFLADEPGLITKKCHRGGNRIAHCRV